MPNHVRNVIKMEGITKLPLFAGEGAERRFDFNKLTPMPETLDVPEGSITDEAIIYYLTEKCTIPLNSVSESGKKVIAAKIHNSFHKGNWAQEVFNSVLDQDARNSEREKEEFYEQGRKYVENYLKYGCTSWFDWCWKNWGTKWNSYDNEIEDEDTIRFSTAWSAPEPIIDKLAEMYPEKVIEHWWADEDSGCNTGYKEYVDGIIAGGYYDDESNEAYENYAYCWGRSDCLERDEDGNWRHKDCDECGLC